MHLTLVDMTPKNIALVKLLHQNCFPVEYPETFYTQLCNASDLVKLGYVADCLVGVVGCKVVDDGYKTLYIMTLGVLSHYRRFGFANCLVNWAIERARGMHIDKLGLHVQVNNEPAIAFYTKHGFTIERTEPEYYPQLDPSAAHYMTKQLD